MQMYNYTQKKNDQKKEEVSTENGRFKSHYKNRQKSLSNYIFMVPVNHFST